MAGQQDLAELHPAGAAAIQMLTRRTIEVRPERVVQEFQQGVAVGATGT
jgi:hypothetical protein